MIKFSIDINSGETKLSSLTDAIVNAIYNGNYKQGDTLPSVNQISREFNISRDTVFKTYKELKSRGMVDSTPAKGYFVSSQKTKILLLLDSYSPFKDDLYTSFISYFDNDYIIDLAFHHHNTHAFHAIIKESIGKYSYYVVMNLDSGEIKDEIKKLGNNNLLLLDWGNCEKEDYSFVCQDFGVSPHKCFDEASDLIGKYKQINYVFPSGSVHPKETWEHLQKFCSKRGIKARFISEITPNIIQKGNIYLFFRQKDLVEILRQIEAKKYEIGVDIGLLAYNDVPIYEFIENGITAISVDFKLMGKKAAECIKSKSKIREMVPAKLILRNSL